ncbi:MAG: transglycosylase domain-containing protein [Bacteroidota bacterium]
MENTTQSERPAEIRAKRMPLYRKIVKWMWRLSIFGIIATVLMFVLLSFQDLPTFEQLENPKSNLASEIYAANGEVLGRYYVENRVPVFFEDLSPHLVQAFVATEDERYYDHSGIDGEALMRVFFKTFLMGNRSAGGASTITQQLAKMLFTDKPGSGLERVIQKLKEWIIAVKLERSYTKEEIMTMYLNKFNFINGAYGIKAASEIYFGKTQDSLYVEEAATLVGMLKNPSLYNPMRRPEKVKHRREVVLSQMMKNDLIDRVVYDSLRNLPLDMSNFRRKTHADGPAPYFRMELGKELKDILSKEENFRPDGTKYDIYRDGLKIYTTLDPVIQKHAEEAMVEHMSRLQDRFNKVWRKDDPWTYEDPQKEPEEIEAENKARVRTLKRLVRETDRYQQLRETSIGDLLEKMAKDIGGFRLRDTDIERMLNEEQKNGSLARLVSRKIVGSKLAVKYRDVMRTEDWEALKKQWDYLQAKVDTVFNQPVKMKVFAYNDQLEKDTTMSPIDSIKYHRMFLQLGSMAVDPVSGHVKAWVGGINHKYFQYDHVTSERQVGSTFKPFIYATAIAQQGISPCFEVLDLPYTIHPEEGNFNLNEDWTPNNADGRYTGKPFTLFKGLQWSKNTVSVFLMKQLGDTEPVRNLVNNMGLRSDVRRSNGMHRIPRVPSISLGSCDLTVSEITGAYTTFANNGIYSKPFFINRIEDKNGRVIYQEIPEERVALHPSANFVMVEMLRSVMRQGIPGFSKVKSDLGGKTGTTNDYVDGWFVGLSPDLVVGTWVGGDDRWIRFLTLGDGIGAKMARPFYGKLINRLEQDSLADYDTEARFFRPPGDLGIVVDCNLYKYDRGEGLDSDEYENYEESENFGNDFFGDEEEIELPDSTNRQPAVEEESEDFGDEFRSSYHN